MGVKNGKTRLISNSGRIALRARKIAEGESLYLDFRFNGRRQYEFLKLILTPAKGLIDKDRNKEILRMAESIRARRELEIHSGKYDITTRDKHDSDFILYFDGFIRDYNKRDNRLLHSTLVHLKTFLKRDSIPCSEINEKLLVKFKSYLDSKFNGETPFNYFKKLKMVLAQATREEYFRRNPAENVLNRKTEGVKKDILDFEEIQLLASTPCNNLHVKNAAIYCCVTGLRFCDVEALKWKNIQKGVMRLTQQKTGKEVLVNLNQTALKLLPGRTRPEDKVFNLPSQTRCLQLVKNWVKAAGIDKHITWHCFRHSFGTNLILFGADARSASSLLGHSSMVETQKYVRLVDSLKEKAVANLPEIEL